MTRLVFRCPKLLPVSPQTALTFHLKPGNLVRISPFWIRAHRVEAPAVLHPGARVEVRVRAFGLLPQRWLVEIAVLQPPDVLVDVALQGPYRRWRHTHRFRSVPGGTEMTDEIEYELPGGWLGRLVDPVFHRPVLRAPFRERHARTARLLGGG